MFLLVGNVYWDGGVMSLKWRMLLFLGFIFLLRGLSRSAGGPKNALRGDIPSTCSGVAEGVVAAPRWLRG